MANTSTVTKIIGGIVGLAMFWAISKSCSHSDTAQPQQTQVVASSSLPDNKPTDNLNNNKDLTNKKIDKNYKKVKQMDYSACLGFQKISGDAISKHDKVIELKKTDTKTIVKYCAVDGATSITCDKNKNTMTLAWADMSGC